MSPVAEIHPSGELAESDHRLGPGGDLVSVAGKPTDQATAAEHADDPMTIGGRTYPREDIPEILGRKQLRTCEM